MLKPKYVKAINYYMRGYGVKESLLTAGFSESVASTNPLQVFGRPDVKKEIENRTKRMVARNKLSEDWIIQRLMTIADANIGDLLTLDEDGTPFIDYSKLSPEMRQAIGVVSVSTQKAGRGKASTDVTRLDVKALDKLRALEMLMKVLGMDKTKVDVNFEQGLIDRLLEGRRRVSSPDEEDTEEQE